MTVRQEHGQLLVGGKQLEIFWAEPESGIASERPVIVMLHEGLGSVALWKDFPQRLAKSTGFSVLAYSRYGHGASQILGEKRPVSFMHHEGEVVLPELLDKLNIRKPVLLGHSDGGSIALVFAGTYPENVRGLVLEAPHVFVEDLTVASIQQAKIAYQTTDLPRRLQRYHQHVNETFWGWNDIWLDPDFRAWNIEEYLAAVRCPVLCIQGEEDEYGTRAQLDAIKAQAPQTEIVMLPNCRHSPHRDQPDATLSSMVEFMGKIHARADSPVRSTADSVKA